MKKIILFAFTALCFIPAKAQDSIRRAYLGIDVSYTRLSIFDKDGCFFSLTYSKGKHELYAGPSLQYYDYWHPQPMWGAQAGYRIFPNGRDKRFNLFFDYNISYMKGTIKDRVNLYMWEMYAGYANRDVNFVTIDNYFGFGFRLNVMKHLYLSSNVGVALGFYKEDYSYTDQSGHTWSGNGKLAARWPIRDNRIFKIGIGYDLVPLKKKRS